MGMIGEDMDDVIQQLMAAADQAKVAGGLAHNRNDICEANYQYGKADATESAIALLGVVSND